MRILTARVGQQAPLAGLGVMQLLAMEVRHVLQQVLVRLLVLDVFANSTQHKAIRKGD